MIEDRVRDGTRIAELLASELDARTDRGLDRVAVVDAEPDVEPTADGARAYDVAIDGDPVASVHVHPERARIVFAAEQDTAADAAGEAGLRVRPTATRPPRTLVFVEDGAEVKRAASVVAAVADGFA